MLKALSVSSWSSGVSLWRSSVRAIADSSALLIVWRSSYDFVSMRVVIPILGLTIYAPSVGFPDFCEPSV